jgi:hypothetical protein
MVARDITDRKQSEEVLKNTANASMKRNVSLISVIGNWI